MNLSKDDKIVTAFAESAFGPGWANHPLWVIVVEPGGKLRQECIQPGEQTREMQILYRVSQAAHTAMTNAVESMRQKGRPK